MFDALLVERQLRETTRGCDSKVVWAVRKACFRAGIVGAAGTDMLRVMCKLEESWLMEVGGGFVYIDSWALKVTANKIPHVETTEKKIILKLDNLIDVIKFYSL